MSDIFWLLSVCLNMAAWGCWGNGGQQNNIAWLKSESAMPSGILDLGIVYLFFAKTKPILLAIFSILRLNAANEYLVIFGVI
ncbi:MAG: hypothetical protein COB08_015635 [Rhodobacteraceae bacterium]|nr:hypothetical protein [Paracoccaceae bacterium]